MKKHFRLLFAVLAIITATGKVHSNIVIDNIQYVETLSFNDEGWNMRLFQHYMYNPTQTIDSIVFENDNKFYKVKTDSIASFNAKTASTYGDYTPLDKISYTLSNNSFEPELALNNQADRIVIRIYMDGHEFPYRVPQYLGWGEGTNIRAIGTDEYLKGNPPGSMDELGFTICNSKSCNIILTGKLYGIDGSVLMNHRLNYYYTWDAISSEAVIATDADGYFIKELPVNKKHELNFFRGANRGGGYHFQPIQISDQPGDTVFADIKLTSITVSEKEVTQAEPQALFFAYPNPAEGFVNFSYILNGTAQEAVMSIFCANGKLLKQLPIPSPEGKIELLLGREFAPGTYTYSVSSQGRIIYQGRFAVK
jgi:hypothetical protein